VEKLKPPHTQDVGVLGHSFIGGKKGIFIAMYV
jgi:hypothetical protein